MNEDKSQNVEELAAKTLSRLRYEWGDQFETKLRKAKRAAQKNPELIEFLEASGLGDDRQIVKLFAELGDEVTLDDDKNEKSGGGKSSQARAARAIIRAVMKSGKKTAYFEGHPQEHEEMVEIMRRLYEMAA